MRRDTYRDTTVKVSDDFLATLSSDSESPSTDLPYLRPNKIEAGKPAVFALLEEDPLEYWLVWGTPKEGGNNQPFRFLEKPSDEDIELELGREFTRALNYDKTAEDRPYKCLTWPVYNWMKKRVEVLEISQISISRLIVRYALQKCYSKNLLVGDFQMEEGKIGGKSKYDGMFIPRDEDENDDIQMANDWKAAQKAGFDLNRLITGGDPFKEA